MGNFAGLTSGKLPLHFRLPLPGLTETNIKTASENEKKTKCDITFLIVSSFNTGGEP